MRFRLLYPGFKTKAVTFSYDDGIIEDKTTTEILNRYGLKGTFNLNSGKSGESKFRENKLGKQIDCSYLVLKDDKAVYSGHEIATHTHTHPHMEGLSEQRQQEEYLTDIKELSTIFGQPIRGSAYPYGTYDSNTIEALKASGIKYSRTTRSTYRFDVPVYWLLWHPTIHHRDPLLWETLSRFYKSKKELALFSLWGHSYEFALDDNFSLLEDFCKSIKSRKDVYNGTNIEIYDYTHAATMLYYRDGHFVNPSNQTVYFSACGKEYSIPAGEKLEVADEQ
ncbi:MAG: polysaccharide deacetylase family protein [Bacillota bacterium]|nr:polysaccharide deacetylase family protein [Bacillota bacterium]